MRWPSRRIWLPTLAVLIAGYAIVAWWLLPEAIRAAHDGRFGLLDRFMAGRDSVPVERYLDAWSALARSVGFVLASAVVIVGASRVIFARRPGQPSQGSPDPTVRDVVWNALWFGLVVGLGEAYYVTGKALILRETIPQFRPAGPNSLWMAPLGDIAAFLVLGLLAFPLVLLLRRLSRPGLAGRVLIGLFVLMALIALMMVPKRLELWSAALLATGLAVQLSRSAALRIEARRAALPGRVARLALVTLVLFAAVRLGESYRERRMLASLGPSAGGPNVLLVVMDTQRAENMSLYGYARPTTPSLERMAADAVVFEHAIASASWTLPSHATMMTGRYNVELQTGWTDALDDRFDTLAEALREQGYRTAGFVANTTFCNDLYGLDQGFARYRDESITPGGAVRSTWIGRNFVQWIRRRLGDHSVLDRRRAERINAELFGWLDQSADDRPFFAFLNYFDSHGPYRAPEPLGLSYAARESRYWLRSDKSSEYSPEELQQLRDNYDGATTYVDHAFGALVSELERRGLLENTIVIVVGDHGEEFGEHGRLGHGANLYLPTLWVPLLIRFPSGAPRGLRVAAPVSPRDIPATVLELATGGRAPGRFPGTSLSRFWREGAEPPAPDTILAELEADQALVIDRYHFIRRANGKVELYDHRADPRESVDLAGQATTLVDKLNAKLDDLSASAEGAIVAGGH